MMPPVVIEIRKADDMRDVVHRAVQALAEGRLVAFPTETVYGLAASALVPAAVERLSEVKGRGANHPYALVVKSADDALDYVPHLGSLARRLARRCWPGPVTLVVDSHPNPNGSHRGGVEEGLISRIPESVRQAVVPGETIGLRVPAHPLVLDVLRMLVGPIVLTSANRTGAPDAVSGADVVRELGGDVDLVLDDGPSRYGQPSTVVRVEGKQFRILREGVVGESTLRRLASFVILFVCTGNTCRSPMAEAICRQLLAERLGCSPDQVEDRGVLVLSAGLGALPGARPTPEAVEVMRSWSLDLSQHESQPLGDQLVRQADLVLVMTRSHRAALLELWPEVAGRVQLLWADQGDVADPIGGPLAVYQQCAEQIRRELEPRIAELDLT